MASVSSTPDENGVYGMLKVRGTCEDENDMNKRAEYLVAQTHSTEFTMPKTEFLSLWHWKKNTAKKSSLLDNDADDDIIHSSVEEDKRRDEDIQKELDDRVTKIKQEEKNGGSQLETIDTEYTSKIKIAFNMNTIDTLDISCNNLKIF